MSKLIPLFPLSMAVLPGQKIRLHIFEDRYKKLINDCLGGSLSPEGKVKLPKEFGVNYTSEDGLAAIGCSLIVVKILKRFKDGRMDVIAQGQRRFRLYAVFDSNNSYRRGRVDFIKESAKIDLISSQNARILKKKFYQLHDEMCVVAGVKSPIVTASRSAMKLLANSALNEASVTTANSKIAAGRQFAASFQSACAIGLDDYQRQTLLELASEHDRLAWLSEMYKAILDQVKTGKNAFSLSAILNFKNCSEFGLSQIH